MGRDLNWYVLPKVIEHDKTKKICINLEFQEDDDVLKEQLYEKITNESPYFDYKKIEGESSSDYFKRKRLFEDKINTTSWKYLYKDEHKIDWCPKCHLFAAGIYFSSLIIDSFHIGHSYSNPYWWSKWNIQEFYLGDSDGDFVSLFKSDALYRQITYDAVQRAKERIKELGEPKRQSDKDAFEEAMELMEFLEKWTSNDDVIVVMKDEL